MVHQLINDEGRYCPPPPWASRREIHTEYRRIEAIIGGKADGDEGFKFVQHVRDSEGGPSINEWMHITIGMSVNVANCRQGY